MARHIWSVLCRSSAIDRDTNALSLFETFEEVTLLAPVDPEAVIPISFQIVSLWMRSDLATGENANGRIFTKDPGEANSKELVTFQIDLRQFQRLRQRINVGGLKVLRPGVKELLIQWESQPNQWETAARLPLEIKIEPTGDAH